MLGYLNRKLGNISVAAKLALGFAVVLLLTLATTISGWRALDDAIVRSQQLSEIGRINDLTKTCAQSASPSAYSTTTPARPLSATSSTSSTACSAPCSSAATSMSRARC